MRHCILAFILLGFSGLMFGQSDKKFSQDDYDKLIRKSNVEIQNYVNAKNELAKVQQDYIKTISSIIEESGIKEFYGANKAEKIQNNQIDWMTNLAPVYVSAADTKKAREERMDFAVKSFGESFGLNSAKQNVVKTQMNAYIKASQIYQSVFQSIQGVLSFGPGGMKKAFIPAQVHQVHQTHQTHQVHN